MEIIVEGYNENEAIELKRMAEESCDLIAGSDAELSIEDGNLYIRKESKYE